jgi:hypothetical protein
VIDNIMENVKSGITLSWVQGATLISGHIIRDIPGFDV